MNLNVLDNIILKRGQSPQEAIANAITLITHVEKLGFSGYWISEHHNTNATATSAS